MSADFHARRDVFPIFVIGRSSILTPASFRGTGFLIAPNVLVTCWHCICQPLEVGQRYAVLAEEGGGYATYPLLSVEQHPRGMDIAMANVDLIPRHGFTLSTEGLSPGDEITTYEYHFADKVPAEGEDVRAQITARFLRGYVTRSFSYDCPGFTHTPSYELDMPVLHELYGSPVIRPGTKEVAGVTFASLKMPRVEQFPADGRKIEEGQAKPAQTVTFVLAHDISSLWSLRGAVTHGKPLKEIALKKEPEQKLQQPSLKFDDEEIRPRRASPRPDGRNDRKPRTETAGSGKPAATPASRVMRVPSEVTSLYHQIRGVKRPFAPADTREKLMAEMERLRRKLERYESQLTHEQLKRVREQRRIVRELRSMYPYGNSDFPPAYLKTTGQPPL